MVPRVNFLWHPLTSALQAADGHSASKATGSRARAVPFIPSPCLLVGMALLQPLDYRAPLTTAPWMDLTSPTRKAGPVDILHGACFIKWHPLCSVTLHTGGQKLKVDIFRLNNKVQFFNIEGN